MLIEVLIKLSADDELAYLLLLLFQLHSLVIDLVSQVTQLQN